MELLASGIQHFRQHIFLACFFSTAFSHFIFLFHFLVLLVAFFRAKYRSFSGVGSSVEQSRSFRGVLSCEHAREARKEGRDGKGKDGKGREGKK